ncbi:MAG: DNA polymerase, partial [Rhodospirillales bacterium]
MIDGSGFIFRAYFAQMGRRDRLQRSDGTPTNAVFIFTKMLTKLVDDTEADYVAVIFDKARKTFRNDIYPDYKANRDDPPEDLIPQFPLVRDATEALNVAAIDMEGYEADDLIATYAREARDKGMEVTIVSSDKDLMQLVGPGVVMLDAMTDKEISEEQVKEKFGVGPDRVIDVQALAGDSTDNVPGVPGIGVKTAASLINEYGDLETVLARAVEIKQPKRREKLIEEADLARISKELVTLKDDVPVSEPLESFRIKKPTPEKLFAFLRENEFNSLIKTWESRFGVSAGDGSEAADSSDGADQANGAETGVGYELVQTTDRLKAWIDAATRSGVVAVDTETTSLDATRAGLVGVSLSAEPGRACYVPLAHKAPEAQGALDLGGSGEGKGKAKGKGRGKDKRGDGVPEQAPLEDTLKLLKPMLEDPSVLKVGQNIKYDMQVLARHGIAVWPVDDTMLLSYVLEGGLHGHGLDELAEMFLDHETIKFADVAGTGKTRVTFDRVPLEKALDYAAEDAEVTGRLHRLLKPRLVVEHMVTVYETLERPLIRVLQEMERHGIRVDGEELKRLSANFATRLADLEAEIHKLAGHEFNIASPKQLGEVLFEEMGLPGGKKLKTGAYATGAEVLEALVDHG